MGVHAAIRRGTKTCLDDEPVNLVDCPSFSVAGIVHHVLAEVYGFVIEFAAYHAVAETATSLVENDTSTTDGLDPIHDKALDDSKLSVSLVSR